ncbi:MAG: pentapeptide repeat-containing protein, partial [Microcystis aeruginosa]
DDASPASIERTLKNLGKAAMEHEKAKLNQLLESEPQQNLDFEDNLVLFQGWKIENFEVLCANNNLTSATVILFNETNKKRYTESAFKKGSVDALFTAFDEALSHLVEIKHTLKSNYLANLEDGKEGAVTVEAVVECDEKEKLNQLLENEPQQNLFFEDNLLLFQGWKIENFEILCANNNLTAATVILCNTKTQERYTESAFKKGLSDALFTAFNEALAHLVEVKHTLKSIYLANLTPGQEGDTTVKAVVEYDGKEVITIHTHENILKAYFFAYVKAMIAVYAPDEYHPDIHSTEELTYLHKIGERDFRGLNFSQVNLMDTEGNLSDAKLMGCNFSKANLLEVNLTNADLTGADLSHADLSKANLTGANLTDVKLDENNLTLLDGTILTNTIMPEINITIIGESRLEKVAQLLKHIDPQSQSRILAVHSMTDSIWWDNPPGQKFWEVNKELIKRGISIQRVFILPEVPTPKHLQVIQEQLNSRIEVACICQEKAKDIEGYRWDDTNLLISENLSVPRNSFTARRTMNGQTESGYISYQTRVVETDKSLFNALWEKSEKLSTQANIQEQLANLST